MGYYPRGSYYEDHKVRNATIDFFFNLFNILFEIIPFLVVLNICGVTNVSWFLLGLLYLGERIVDFARKLIYIFLEYKDKKKREEEYAKMARKYEEDEEDEEYV